MYLSLCYALNKILRQRVPWTRSFESYGRRDEKVNGQGKQTLQGKSYVGSTVGTHLSYPTQERGAGRLCSSSFRSWGTAWHSWLLLLKGRAVLSRWRHLDVYGRNGGLHWVTWARPGSICYPQGPAWNVPEEKAVHVDCKVGEITMRIEVWGQWGPAPMKTAVRTGGGVAWISFCVLQAQPWNSVEMWTEFTFFFFFLPFLSFSFKDKILCQLCRR